MLLIVFSFLCSPLCWMSGAGTGAGGGDAVLQMNELQARDLRSWCPLMHAAWSGSAEVFRAVVVAIEDNLGRDQVWW